MKALTWEEFKDLTIRYRSFHVWVQFLEFDDEEPDLFAALGEGNDVYGPCAVWCTDPNEKPLTKETYGTEWVAWVDMERLTNLEED